MAADSGKGGAGNARRNGEGERGKGKSQSAEVHGVHDKGVDSDSEGDIEEPASSADSVDDGDDGAFDQGWDLIDPSPAERMGAAMRAAFGRVRIDPLLTIIVTGTLGLVIYAVSSVVANWAVVGLIGHGEPAQGAIQPLTEWATPELGVMLMVICAAGWARSALLPTQLRGRVARHRALLWFLGFVVLVMFAVVAVRLAFEIADWPKSSGNSPYAGFVFGTQAQSGLIAGAIAALVALAGAGLIAVQGGAGSGTRFA